MRLRERSPALWKQRGYIGVGNRRGIGGMTFRERIAAMIKGADFRSELEYTAIPQRAAAGTTFSFTRATAKRWKNNDGYEVVGLAGEIDFPGARRVHNLIAPTYSSENMTVNNITSFPVAITPNDITPPAGYSRADRQTSTTAVSRSGAFMYDPHVVPAGETAMLVCVAMAGSGRYLCFGDQSDSLWRVMTLDTQDGSITTTNLLTATAEEIEPGWWKMVMTFTKGITGAVGALCCHSPTDTNPFYPFMDAGEYWWVTGFQIHDLTTETDKTTARPYVSVGIESAPYYHGSMVDGVKCFATDINGNPLTTMERHKPESLATNYITQSNNLGAWTPLGTPSATQNAVGPNGQANYAWTLTDNDATGWEGVQTSPAFAAGATGCLSVLVEKKASSPVYPLVLAYYNAAGGLATGVIVNEVLGTLSAITGGGYAAPQTPLCTDFNDDYWLVSIGMTQAGANLTATCELYAAGSTDGTTLSSAAQGSTVFSEAQFEQGTTVPSSRIATAGAAVSRNADVGVYSGGDVPNFKMLMVGFQRDVGATPYSTLAALTNGTSSTYAGIFLGTGNQLQFAGAAASVAQWDNLSSIYTPGTDAKACQSWATNDVKMGFNGATVTPDTSATVPAVTQLQVGHYTASLYHANANIGPLVGWTRNGSQTEVNAVSTP